MATPVAVLNSQTHYISDGSTTLWDFSFAGGYLSKDHVKAYKRAPDNTRTEIPLVASNFVADTRLSITGVPSGHRLVIYRATPTTGPLVDWQAASTIVRSDLDTTAKQAVFVAAEAADLYGATTQQDLVALSQQAATAVATAAASAAAASTAKAQAEAAAATVQSVVPDLADTASLTKGAGLVGFSSSLAYAASTVGGFLRKLVGNATVADGASNIGLRREAGSNATTVHDWIAGQPWRNVLTDYGTIQAAINAANAAGGGRVVIPRKAGGWNIGTAGLTIYQNVTLEGEVESYVNSTRGVEIIYSGSGSAISGANLLNVHIKHLSIDCTNTTGSAVNGLFFDGIWMSSVSDVRIKGVGPWKGYGILVKTGTSGGPWGTQHNTFERVECADGIIRMEGPTSIDGVTTTVLNTVRGYLYEFVHSQGAAINCTSECVGPAYSSSTTYQPGQSVLSGGIMYVAKVVTTNNVPTNTSFWYPLPNGGAGMTFSGIGTDFTVMACDMEGNLPTGALITSNAVVREAGSGWIWLGFSGAARVTGNTSSSRSYGGAYEWLGQLAAGAPVTVETFGNQNLGTYLREEIVPVNVTGGAQEGYRRWSRFIGGAEVLTHEFQRNALVEHTKTFSAVTAQTVLSIRIPTARGLVVECTAEGAQIGDQTFVVTQRVVARNGAGTVTAANDTALTVPAAYSGAFSFVASGDTLQIKYTPSTANSSNLNFTFNINGAFLALTKG